jgi:hypothetical protein
MIANAPRAVARLDTSRLHGLEQGHAGILNLFHDGLDACKTFTELGILSAAFEIAETPRMTFFLTLWHWELFLMLALPGLLCLVFNIPFEPLVTLGIWLIQSGGNQLYFASQQTVATADDA